MTSHLVQAYVDKENTTSLSTNTSKGRISSLAGRQGMCNLYNDILYAIIFVHSSFCGHEELQMKIDL